jgi:hypothetical protein
MLRLTIALTLILAAPAAAKPGDLDRSFGSGGRIAFAVGDGYSSASGMLLDGHGRALLAGEGRVNPLGSRIAAARLTAAGLLDPAFGSGGRLPLVSDPRSGPLTGTPQLIARLPGGGAVIAAALETDGGTHAEVYRIDAAGRQDMTFGEGGVAEVHAAPHLIPVALATQGGKILVLATVFKRGLDSPDRAELIRLRADGSAERRVTVGRNVSAGAMLANGQGVTVGTYRPGRKGHPGRVILSAFRPDGSREENTASFALHSRDRSHPAGVVAILPGPGRTLFVAGNDGSGGSFTAGRHWPWLARIGPNGRLDRRFGRNGRVRPVGTRGYDSIRAATLDRRGRVLLAGAHGEIDLGDPQAMVMRFSPSGRLDRRLGVRRVELGAQRGVRLIGSEARAVAIDARGRIVLAGVAFDDNVEIREDLGRSYFAVARLHG